MGSGSGSGSGSGGWTEATDEADTAPGSEPAEDEAGWEEWWLVGGPAGDADLESVDGEDAATPAGTDSGLIWSAVEVMLASLGEVQQTAPGAAVPQPPGPSGGTEAPFVGLNIPTEEPAAPRPSSEDLARYILDATRASRDAKQEELARSIRAEHDAASPDRQAAWIANSNRLRGEIAALDARLRAMTTPSVMDRVAQAGPPRTLLDIRPGAPAVERFAVGMLRGLNNSFNGLVVVVNDPAGAAAALGRLSTDGALQAAFVDALLAKLSDTSPENLGEITFEVASLVGPGAAAGGARAAGNAARIVVNVSRETAAAIRGATAEIRAALRAAWLDDLARARPNRLDVTGQARLVDQAWWGGEFLDDDVRLAYRLPQGLTQANFEEAGRLIRSKATGLGDDIVVQGSRVAGTARPTSDIDFAIRVSPERFDELVRERFGAPPPGSAKERTMLHAIATGKIQAGEAGLRPLRRELEGVLGMDVDISVIRRGGPFDSPPFTPVP